MISSRRPMIIPSLETFATFPSATWMNPRTRLSKMEMHWSEYHCCYVLLLSHVFAWVHSRWFIQILLHLSKPCCFFYHGNVCGCQELGYEYSILFQGASRCPCTGWNRARNLVGLRQEAGRSRVSRWRELEIEDVGGAMHGYHWRVLWPLMTLGKRGRIRRIPSEFCRVCCSFLVIAPQEKVCEQSLSCVVVLFISFSIRLLVHFTCAIGILR